MLAELYEKNWVDEWYKNKKQKLTTEKGLELLKNFYGYSMNNPPKPKYLEQSFYLPWVIINLPVRLTERTSFKERNCDIGLQNRRENSQQKCQRGSGPAIYLPMGGKRIFRRKS